MKSDSAGASLTDNNAADGVSLAIIIKNMMEMKHQLCVAAKLSGEQFDRRRGLLCGFNTANAQSKEYIVVYYKNMLET